MDEIKRVIGKVNGQDIIFSKGEGNWWDIAIPPSLSGEYVVEVYAEDVAGNYSYLCKMLFSICGHELQVRILDGGLTGEVKASALEGVVSIGEFLASIQERKITVKPEEVDYVASVQEGGYKCERIVCSRDGS